MHLKRQERTNVCITYSISDTQNENVLNSLKSTLLTVNHARSSTGLHACMIVQKSTKVNETTTKEQVVTSASQPYFLLFKMALFNTETRSRIK